MPKATVDENDRPVLGQHDIRLSGQLLHMQPKAKPMRCSIQRTTLSSDLLALATFNDRLLDRGWLDAHASRYEARRWMVRGERTYQVRRGFPRLVEVDLPTGVGDVNFAVSLAACEPFATQASGFELTPLRSPPDKRRLWGFGFQDSVG